MMNMNDRILSDPPRSPDGYAQGCAWCVVLGAGMLVAAIIGIMAGVA